MSLAVHGAPVMWVGVNPAHFTTVAVFLLPLYAVRAARREGLDVRTMYWGALATLSGALLGGRTLILLFDDRARVGAIDWMHFASGGTSSLGALVGAALAGAAYAYARRLPLVHYADAIVPAALLAYAVARVGCLLNGDDFGTLTMLPWAVRHPPGTVAYAEHLGRGWIERGAVASLAVHPWPLYSALVALALFSLLRRTRWTAGMRTSVALIGYGGVRFFLEFLRGDERAVLGSLVLSQLLCAAIVVIGTALWLRTRPGVRERVTLLVPARVSTVATR